MAATSVQEHVFTFKRIRLFYAGESFANEVFASSMLLGTARTELRQFYRCIVLKWWVSLA